jgi:topoisomerase-4 subunit A
VADREQNWLASVTTEGRLLVFKISDLPHWARARATRSSVFR